MDNFRVLGIGLRLIDARVEANAGNVFKGK